MPAAAFALFLTLLSPLAIAAEAAEAPAHTSETALKWVRDSAEYHGLTTQTYRAALGAVRRQSKKLKKGQWAVILDVDETVLDNSTYQLERHAYGLPYDSPSWHAWCRREAAAAIPGAKDFVDGVRSLGGTVVYLTNRKDVVAAPTQANLVAEGLWTDGDLLCPRTETSDKAPRRAAVRAGTGGCTTGKPLAVVAYLGDSWEDLPRDGEDGGARMDELGKRFFVLPNPLYGHWTAEDAITRPDLAPPPAAE